MLPAVDAAQLDLVHRRMVTGGGMFRGDERMSDDMVFVFGLIGVATALVAASAAFSTPVSTPGMALVIEAGC
jgi:hypothetical protein